MRNKQSIKHLFKDWQNVQGKKAMPVRRNWGRCNRENEQQQKAAYIFTLPYIDGDLTPVSVTRVLFSQGK